MRILVSFFAKQRLIARRVIEDCRSRGIDAENNDLRLRCHGRADFQNYLADEIRTYDAVVILWSKEYSRDEWLQHELFAINTIKIEREFQFVYIGIIDKTPVNSTVRDSVIVDLKDRIDDGLHELITSIPQNKNLFVIMKFSDKQLDSTYRTIIKPVAEEFGHTVLRIDEREKSDSVTDNILKQIEGSGTIICDLTGERPNVYFEAGYALALRKEIILSAMKGTNIHFDLADRGTLFWESPEELKTMLTRRLRSLAGSRM